MRHGMRILKITLSDKCISVTTYKKWIDFRFLLLVSVTQTAHYEQISDGKPQTGRFSCDNWIEKKNGDIALTFTFSFSSGLVLFIYLFFL